MHHRHTIYTMMKLGFFVMRQHKGGRKRQENQNVGKF